MLQHPMGATSMVVMQRILALETLRRLIQVNWFLSYRQGLQQRLLTY